ncbi:hypothetical protein DDR33_13690 [Pararcticibacter amylolyticus]|uniref:DUF4302 domain-containing protein n=2 Tax=Pararcticibacter amylolyticus TaxID=2173175 RepID=A0A2U2PGI5_9SPHI|nr:hypothetical protein DDR33_13690 [Pararcticibacter amylolyticus]
MGSLKHKIMKRLLWFCMAIAFGLTACKKDDVDLAFGEKPEVRVEKALQQYKSELVSSENGWVATLYPAGGGGYNFYIDFEENDRVSMFADIASSTAGAAYGSTYRLKAAMVPSLYFDTYSYIHILADPDPSVYGGTRGWGVFSDFEFAFSSVKGDSIELKGNLSGSKLILVKASKAQADSYKAGDFKKAIDETVAYVAGEPFLFTEFGDGKKVQTSVNAAMKTFSILNAEEGGIKATSSFFSFTLTGIHLQDTMRYGGNAFTDVYWDDDKPGLYILTHDNKRLEIQASETPVFPMHLLLGTNFTTVAVPAGTISGMSPEFITRRQQAAANVYALLSSPLTLADIDFVFNTEERLMDMDAYIYQNNQAYLARFSYSYTKTSDGVFKFRYTGANGNADLIKNAMAPLLNYINNDRFSMEYYSDPDKRILGKIASIDNAGFYFTGNLE